MILEWKQDRLLLLPVLAGSSSQQRRLLGGINEVDNDYWVLAKKQKTIQKHLEAGNLVEMKEVSVITKKGKTLQSDIQKNSADLQLKDAELKELKKKLKKCKTIEDKEATTVHIDGLSEEVRELKELLASLETQLLDEMCNFNQVEHRSQVEFINNTYSTRLLEKWSKEDSKAEVRNVILNRIEELKKPIAKDGV